MQFVKYNYDYMLKQPITADFNYIYTYVTAIKKTITMCCN